MSNLSDSIAAIERYSPKNNVYLRVVGEGENVRLEAVTKCWLGRILMWLGLTSACMTKVANFIACNMDGLCKTWFENAQKISKNRNSLGDLVSRVSLYDSKHPKNITSQTLHIVNTYRQWLSYTNKSQPKPALSVITNNSTAQVPFDEAPTAHLEPDSARVNEESEEEAPDTNDPDVSLSTTQVVSQNSAQAPSVISQQPLVILPQQSSAPVTTTLVAIASSNQPPNNPLTAIPALASPRAGLSIIPTQTPLPSGGLLMPGGSGVERYYNCRGAAKQLEEDLFKSTFSEDESWVLAIRVGTEMQSIKALLNEAAADPKQFKEILKKMDPIDLLAYCRFSTVKYLIFQSKKLEDMDVFGLYDKSHGGQSLVLNAIVSYLDCNEIENIIVKLLTVPDIKNTDLIFTLGQHIYYRKNLKERTRLLETIVISSLYENLIEKQAPLSSQLELVLSDTYLRMLVANPNVYTKDMSERDRKLNQYLDKYLFTPTMNTTCRLQDTGFLSTLNAEEKYLFGKAIFQHPNFKRSDIVNCRIIQQLVENNPEIGQRFYEFSEGTNPLFSSGFHQEMRTLNPLVEHERIKQLVNDPALKPTQRNAAMNTFVKLTFSNGVKSISPKTMLNDPASFAKFDEDEIILIGAALFKSFPGNKCDSEFLTSFLISDPKKAADRIHKIYKKVTEMDMRFDKYSIIGFYYKKNVPNPLIDELMDKVGHRDKLQAYLSNAGAIFKNGKWIG